MDSDRQPLDASSATESPADRRVLVTGATGYIGRQLLPRLLDAGWRVRVLSRDRHKIDDAGGRVEVMEGDATCVADLDRALAGVDVAYYLLHSMDGRGDFVARDRQMAQDFAAAADRAHVSRIVYLSGLHPQGELSDHLASRVEVGEIFLAGPVPAVVLQAGVVLGDGSASFDMLRHLTERLPAMIAPKWARNQIQPIAARDAVHYLVAAAAAPPGLNRTVDIGGPDVLTYAEMMSRYAQVTGLGRRLIVTVPVLSPGLASHWVGVITPVPSGIARPLVGSLIHDAVCSDHDAADLLGAPPGGELGYDDAIRWATRSVHPRRWRTVVTSVVVATAVAAALGSAATDPREAWYRSLRLPAWQPPPLAFPVVWSALYADIAGMSALTIADLVEQDRRREAGRFAAALGINLALNAGWSAIFWRVRRLDAATVEAAVLALSSADLVRRAGSVSRARGVALAPYAAWCGFATVLTAAVARRNPPRAGRGRRRNPRRIESISG